MLHLILVETALELIPKSLRSEKCVQQNIKKYKNVAKLLDTSLHHTIMKSLPNSEKRGRPDILHHYLLDTLGSPANLSQNLKIYFNIKTDLFQVSSNMRCPRDFHRFKGLMAQLLKLGHIPKKKPYLIKRITNNFKDWIKNHFSDGSIYKFTSEGKKYSLDQLTSKIVKKPSDSLIIVGGFQKGHFSNYVKNLSGMNIAISSKGYDSWIVITRILAFFEHSLGLL